MNEELTETEKAFQATDEYLDGADRPFAKSLVRLLIATIRATKEEGMSRTANREEETALRLFLREAGYGQAHLRKRIEAYVRARVD